MTESKIKQNPKSTAHGSESDIVSFWLLLLFVAVFFGIAAEEARRPMFGDRAALSPIANSAHEIKIPSSDPSPDKKTRTTK